MAWRLANSLTTLRNQVNAAYPARNKASDGTIGDAAHSSRTSQHNPNPAGVVTAMDITHDPAHGVNGQTLADACVTDSRCWYVIFNRRIRYNGGAWQAYSGTNPHTAHVHISVKQDAGNYDNNRSWQLSAASAGGNEVFQSIEEVKEAYVQMRGVVGTDAEMRPWIGQSKQRWIQLSTLETNSTRQQLAEVRQALLNEQSKPPKEVVKEVIKIVDRPVEVIKEIEVVKEVEPGWLTAAVNFIRKLLRIKD